MVSAPLPPRFRPSLLEPTALSKQDPGGCALVARLQRYWVDRCANDREPWMLPFLRTASVPRLKGSRRSSSSCPEYSTRWGSVCSKRALGAFSPSAFYETQPSACVCVAAMPALPKLRSRGALLARPRCPCSLTGAHEGRARVLKYSGVHVEASLYNPARCFLSTPGILCSGAP